MELEILEYNESGYKGLVSYNGWRVALANPHPRWVDGQITYVERHLKTDEVFVLLSGEAVLYIGEERKRYILEPGKLYCVKKGVWHNMAMAESAKMLIVENDDTCKDNTEYCDF